MIKLDDQIKNSHKVRKKKKIKLDDQIKNSHKVRKKKKD